MIKKKITITYHTIEAAEDNYFSNFYNNAEIMLDSDNLSGTFEAGELTYQWELLEKIDTDKTPMYMFSLVKEKKEWPVLIHDDGGKSELLVDGILGDIHYALVCPAYKFILCDKATLFKKLLGQFSPEGVVRLNPFFEEDIDEKVMLWDNYKKLSIRMNMPSGDDVKSFTLNTKAGEHMTLIDYLGGLKLDITVSAGTGKECLSAMMVKDLIPELLANDHCTSLTVKGSDYENATSEQFDLKNAQIKYSEQIAIEGNYITETDAKQVLMQALNDRAEILFVER